MRALIVLGHGSRSPEATAQFLSLVEQVRLRQPGTTVAPAFMELADPSLDASVAAAIAAGATDIVVLPCFLFIGRHLQRDIPNMLGELQVRYPRVTFSLRGPLGADPRIADILCERVEGTPCPA
jgi:sirohydrochlorin ferrochelatase